MNHNVRRIASSVSGSSSVTLYSNCCVLYSHEGAFVLRVCKDMKEAKEFFSKLMDSVRLKRFEDEHRKYKRETIISDSGSSAADLISLCNI